MPFKAKDWLELIARFRLGRAQVDEFRKASTELHAPRRYLLDSAVTSVWSMAEYAINVHLELAGQPPERRHRTCERARELRLSGRLVGNYEKILAQLERYRLAASYLGYGHEPSVHYNATNVEDCFAKIQQLVDETADALRAAGKVAE